MTEGCHVTKEGLPHKLTLLFFTLIATTIDFTSLSVRYNNSL